MVQSVRIEGLRGVREGVVDGLSPMSILLGPNNCGKSTVLEAILIAGIAADPREVVKSLLRRGGPSREALRQAFHSEEEVRRARIVVDGSAVTLQYGGDVEATYLQLARQEGLADPVEPFRTERTGGRAVTYTDRNANSSSPAREFGSWTNLFDVALLDVEAVRAQGALEDAYSKIEFAAARDRVVESLRKSMPDLVDLRLLKPNVDEPAFLYTTHSKTRPTPAFVAGDGFKRLIEIFAATVAAKSGVVLLEEPESFQHPRYLRELSKWLHDSVVAGQQIILSTHSIELVDQLLADAPESATYPSVHRLRLFDGTLAAVALDRALAQAARESLLEDLRA